MSRNRFVGPNFRCHVWNNVWGWGQEDVAYRLANAGVDVVLCNATHLYFDLAYNKDPKEPGYYWAGFVDTKTPYSFAPMNYLANTRKDLLGQEISQDAIAQHVELTEKGEKHILGIQGQLWGENLKGEKRLEYMALPRLIALAERAWARQPEWARESDQQTWPSKLERAWSEFANRLGARELPRLDYLEGGFHYRIPGVGAVIEDGVLKANVAYPGLTIRYTTDGSEPNVDSPVYTKPVQVGDFARVRATIVLAAEVFPPRFTSGLRRKRFADNKLGGPGLERNLVIISVARSVLTASLAVTAMLLVVGRSPAVELIGFVPYYQLSSNYLNNILPEQISILDEVRYFGLSVNSFGS